MQRFVTSRLMAAFLVLGLLVPVTRPAFAENVSGAVPEVRSGAQARRPWFARQLSTVMSREGADKDTLRLALAAELQKRIRVQSEETRAQLTARSKANVRTIQDVIVVGGGIHSAIFNSAMTKTYPEARVLTLEASDQLVKVFNGCGPMFRINSPELGTATSNLIAEAPVQLAQLTSARFATAEMLGHVALFAHYNSISGFMLGAKVAKIVPAGDYYEVQLAEGLKLYARHVVVATGLGKPDLKTDDAQTQEIVLKETSEQCAVGQEVPGIQFFDDAVVKAKLALDIGVGPLEAYANKRVAVIGAGDAGNVFVEFMLGKAPAEVYAKSKTPVAPAKVMWIGQKSTSYDEFKAANKPRYHEPMKDLYENTKVEMTAAKLHSIRYNEAGHESGAKFAITVKTADATRTLHADKIVISTGYANLAPGLIAHCGASPRLEPFRGKARDIAQPTALAQQVVSSDGTRHRVYVVGPAAAPLALDEELKATITKNHHSINVLGPRTEGLALFLGGLLMGQ